MWFTNFFMHIRYELKIYAQLHTKNMELKTTHIFEVNIFTLNDFETKYSSRQFLNPHDPMQFYLIFQ